MKIKENAANRSSCLRVEIKTFAIMIYDPCLPNKTRVDLLANVKNVKCKIIHYEKTSFINATS